MNGSKDVEKRDMKKCMRRFVGGWVQKCEIWRVGCAWYDG